MQEIPANIAPVKYNVTRIVFKNRNAKYKWYTVSVYELYFLYQTVPPPLYFLI